MKLSAMLLTLMLSLAISHVKAQSASENVPLSANNTKPVRLLADRNYSTPNNNNAGAVVNAVTDNKKTVTKVAPKAHSANPAANNAPKPVGAGKKPAMAPGKKDTASIAPLFRHSFL